MNKSFGKLFWTSSILLNNINQSCVLWSSKIKMTRNISNFVFKSTCMRPTVQSYNCCFVWSDKICVDFMLEINFKVDIFQFKMIFFKADHFSALLFILGGMLPLLNASLARLVCLAKLGSISYYSLPLAHYENSPNSHQTCQFHQTWLAQEIKFRQTCQIQLA